MFYLAEQRKRISAHIPVLEMIDSLNIDVDLIVGTSIGANVGALYSVGYTSDQIYEHAFKKQIGKQFFLKILNVKI